MKKFLSIIIALAIIASFAIIPASAASVAFPNVVINGGYATFNLTVSDSTGVGSIDVDFSVSGGTIESVTTGQGMVSGTSHASFMASGEPSSVTLTIKVKASGDSVTINYSGLEVTSGATGDYSLLSASASGSAKAEAPATTTTTAPATTAAPQKNDVTKQETTTAKKTVEKAELSALKVIANNDVAVALVSGTYDYDIKVPYGTKSLTVDATGLDDAKVEVVGADNISDGSVVTINVTNKDGSTSVYKVKVAYEEPEVKQVVEREGVSKGLVIVIALALFFLGLIIGLLLGFLIGKKKFENVDYYDGGTSGFDPGFESGSADDYDDGVASPFQTSGFNFESAGGMGFNYDFANDGFEESADDAVSLRDPVYSEPEPIEPVAEPIAAEPAAVNIPPVAPVAVPVAEPTPAPVAEPIPAYTAPEPAYAAPAPAYAPVEPVAEPIAAPVAESVAPVYEAPAAPVYEAPVAPEPVVETPAYTAPEPAYTAPVAEPVAEPAPDLSGLVAPNPVAEPVAEPVAAYQPPVAEPAYTAPVVEPVAEPAYTAPVVETTPEPIAAEPSYATPYVDDAPPVLPYQAGTEFGSVPFEQSAD